MIFLNLQLNYYHFILLLKLFVTNAKKGLKILHKNNIYVIVRIIFNV